MIRIILLVLFALLPLAGCGSGATPPPKMTADQEQQRQKEMQKVQDEERAQQGAQTPKSK